MKGRDPEGFPFCRAVSVANEEMRKNNNNHSEAGQTTPLPLLLDGFLC